MCTVESTERGWIELGEEKGRLAAVSSKGFWTGKVAQKTYQSWQVHMGNSICRWMLKVTGPEISRAMSKHQVSLVYKNPCRKQKKKKKKTGGGGEEGKKFRHKCPFCNLQR